MRTRPLNGANSLRSFALRRSLRSGSRIAAELSCISQMKCDGNERAILERRNEDLVWRRGYSVLVGSE